MKHLCILGIFVVIGIFFGIILVEVSFFDGNPPQIPSDITIEDWKASFQHWSAIVLGAALVASLLWYVSAQCIFKINKPKDAEKRLVWSLFALVPIVASVIGILSSERVESGHIEIYILFVLNGLLPYYFATVLLSPSSFKYTPVLASLIRRW
jgi:uncharacterized membrane protein YfcA